MGEPSVRTLPRSHVKCRFANNSYFHASCSHLPVGVDPKSVLCEFFRHGQCTKGFKCKYSHDLAVERKGPKIDLFTDQRDTGGEDEVRGTWPCPARECGCMQCVAVCLLPCNITTPLLAFK